MALEVHVGDIGTKYKVRIRDENGDFDPSGAVLHELIFKLPVHGVVVVEADVESEGSPADVWFLTYTVRDDSIESPASPQSAFHAAPGRVRVQGRITYGDGTVFTTDVQTTDDDGATLRIYPNLDS